MMNKLLTLAGLSAAAVLIQGCDDDDPSFLRSSTGIATSDIRLFVSAQVHEADEDEPAHTHLSVEPYGYSSEGYLYNIEMVDGDAFGLTVNGETTAIEGVPIFSEADKLLVEYSAEVEVNDPGSELTLTLERSANTTTTSVVLPELTPMTVLPESGDFNLVDDVIVEWVELENTHYALRFFYDCELADGESTSKTLRYSSHDEELDNPFTFVPGEHFSPSSELDISACELTVRLISHEEQLDVDSDYAHLDIDLLRYQDLRRSLDISTITTE